MEACGYGVTTDILYECDGLDADSGRRFHCWITNRTIPLDEICRNDIAIKSRCSVAAFFCRLSAVRHGLYLSDCHFFNFGALLTESATEHLVVIIDAGSRGIHRDGQWKKSYQYESHAQTLESLRKGVRHELRNPEHVAEP